MIETSPKTIVLAEDDQFLLKGYTTALEEEGHNVHSVSNGADVVSTVEKVHPDLLVLDLILPVTTGFEVLEQLRADEVFRDLPIIISTSLGQDEDREEVMALGATDHIVKSHTTVQQFVDKVTQHLKA